MEFSSVGGVDECFAYLESSGETPELSGTEILLSLDLSPTLSTRIHIAWNGAVTFRVPLMLTVADDMREKVIGKIADLNGDIDAGACVLGPPLAYEVIVPRGADGRVDLLPFEEGLAAARSWALCCHSVLAVALRPKYVPPPLPPFTPGSQAVKLTADELARVKAACADGCRGFLHRLDGHLDCYLRLQPWWRSHRIIEVQSPLPMPAEGVPFSFGPDGGVKLLRGHLNHLHEVIAKDPLAAPLTNPDEARAYAMFANQLTTDARWGELPVSSFDEIPFRTLLDPHERATINELRDRHGAGVHPPQLKETADGFSLKLWVVSMSRLIEREITVSSDGAIQRREILHGDPIPVPPGKAWQIVNNRPIPVA